MRSLTLLLAFMVTGLPGSGQTITTMIPDPVNPSGKYLFYLHGQLVTLLGNNALNQSYPEWGPYEYMNILDSLSRCGFHVISENRRPELSDTVYIQRLAAQADSLLKGGVTPENILIIGASAGWHIVLHAAARLQNQRLHYVLMGGCWPETYKSYQNISLSGCFLSVIEQTDPHGTCTAIFNERKVNSFKEVTLHTGLSHGFFYKPRREWMQPILDWFAAGPCK